MAKVELHRHLEGSLRLATIKEIAQQHALTVPDSIVDLSGLVQVQDADPLTFNNFLEKFRTLRLFYRSPEVIRRVTSEAVEDAARDNVRYLELRFTPVALSRMEDFPMREVMDWVITSTQEAAKQYGIKVNLLASVNRHESPELAEQVAALAVDSMSRGVVGLDLAGNEAEFDCKPFIGIFKEARQAGLRLSVHAGEWGPADNVRRAIEQIDTDRIGHGVRVMQDPSVVALARERGVTFEVCVTSNYQSGVVPSLMEHPLPSMIEAGLDVTINTDDPSISRITLSREYQAVCEDLKVPMDVLKERVVAAARAAFLPPQERDTMVTALKNELQR